jgi:hypothetical protein
MMRFSLGTTLAVAGTILALAIAAPAEAAIKTITVTIDDAGTCSGTWQTSGSITNPVYTCVTSTSTAPTAPVCSITPSQTVSSGTSVTLTLANCSPSTGLSFSWRKDTTSGTQVSTAQTYTTPGLTTTTKYYATVTSSAGSTTYSTTVTVSGSSPPPTTTSCSGYTTVNLGDLHFDGSRVATSGVTGSAVAYGRIVVPSGWAGKVASIAIYEYIDPQYAKKAYLSKNSPCGFTAVWPAYGEGSSMNLKASFDTSLSNAVRMNAGEIWYLTVKNERLSGAPSCGSGSCNFAITMSVPSP